MTVPLPESGDGTRRKRREQRRRRGRRVLLRAIAVLVGFGAAGLGAWAVGTWVLDDDPERAPADDDATQAAAGPAEPSLVLLRDDDGDVYGITILVPATASIVHVPPGTLLDVPSLGLASLRDAGRAGDVELVQQSLENLLGARFESVLTLAPADLAAEVRRVGPLAVTVDDAVEERESTGRVTIVVPSGAQTLSPETATTFLVAVGDGSSLDRIVRHQAFWSAYLAAAAGGDAPIAAIDAMAGTDVQQRVLPVEAVAGIEAEDELYRVVEDDLADLIDRVLPGGTDRSERIRVQILNGVGAPGVAQRVQPLLVDADGRVTLTGNADRFDYEVTQVVYYDDEWREAAEAIRDALGVGEIVKSLRKLGVVDVTVVVGADFMAAHPGG